MDIQEAKQFLEDHKDYDFGAMTQGMLIGILLGKDLKMPLDIEVAAKTKIRDEARKIIKEADGAERLVELKAKQQAEEDAANTLIEAVVISGATRDRKKARSMIENGRTAYICCGFDDYIHRIDRIREMAEYPDSIVRVKPNFFAYIDAEGKPHKLKMVKPKKMEVPS